MFESYLQKLKQQKECHKTIELYRPYFESIRCFSYTIKEMLIFSVLMAVVYLCLTFLPYLFLDEISANLNEVRAFHNEYWGGIISPFNIPDKQLTFASSSEDVWKAMFYFSSYNDKLSYLFYAIGSVSSFLSIWSLQRLFKAEPFEVKAEKHNNTDNGYTSFAFVSLLLPLVALGFFSLILLFNSDTKIEVFFRFNLAFLIGFSAVTLIMWLFKNHHIYSINKKSKGMFSFDKFNELNVKENVLNEQISNLRIALISNDNEMVKAVNYVKEDDVPLSDVKILNELFILYDSEQNGKKIKKSQIDSFEKILKHHNVNAVEIENS